MRCAHCGALYTTSWTRRYDKFGQPGALWRYYACSTRHYRQQFTRRRPGSGFPRECIGMSLDATAIEAKIWADVEQFVRNPGATLLELAARVGDEATAADVHRAELSDLQQKLDEQQAERDAVLALYRKGRINERDLDRQLDDIATEEAGVTARRDALTAALSDSASRQDRLQNARTLLQQLHARLDDPEQPATPAVQRAVVKALVQSIRVETVEIGISTRGRIKRQAQAHVRYSFERPTISDIDAGYAPAQSSFSQASASR
jgi:site-specific DNA recombinase